MDARRLAHYVHYSRPRCELSRVFTDGACGGQDKGFFRVLGIISLEEVLSVSARGYDAFHNVRTSMGGAVSS